VSPEWGLPLLSLMRANVAPSTDIFKHVFEVCRVRDFALTRQKCARKGDSLPH